MVFCNMYSKPKRVCLQYLIKILCDPRGYYEITKCCTFKCNFYRKLKYFFPDKFIYYSIAGDTGQARIDNFISQYNVLKVTLTTPLGLLQGSECLLIEMLTYPFAAKSENIFSRTESILQDTLCTATFCATKY